MGEERRRRAEREQQRRAQEEWLATLPPAEHTAATVSQRAFERIVLRRGFVGSCYLLAFFLNRFLRTQHDIATEVIVGWVNDGTWFGMASHAWILLNGKKIDIALALTEDSDAQPSGDLIILDRVVRTGQVRYSYHREQPPESIAYLQKLVREGDLSSEAVAFKDREHAIAQRVAASPEGIAAFLDAAPPDRNYRALVQVLN